MLNKIKKSVLDPQAVEDVVVGEIVVDDLTNAQQEDKAPSVKSVREYYDKIVNAQQSTIDQQTKEIESLHKLSTNIYGDINLLLNRKTNNSFIISDFFNNRDNMDESMSTVKIMDDNSFDNNWIKVDNSYKQGYISNKKKNYMMEIIDFYNIDNVFTSIGSSRLGKVQISSYDQKNDCFWGILSRDVNTAAVIYKISANMTKNQVEVLGMWNLPSPGANRVWTSIDTDGSVLWIGYMASYGTATNSGIYALTINSDNTLGADKVVTKGNITLGTSTYASYTSTTLLPNGYSIQGILNWNETEIGVLICNNTPINNDMIRIIFLLKNLSGAGTTNAIGGFQHFCGSTESLYYKSICKNGNDIYLLSTQNSCGNIYKFNLNTDIVNDIVVKASGRFNSVYRSTIIPSTELTGNAISNYHTLSPLCGGGITIAKDGNFLELIDSETTTLPTSVIYKRALINVPYAENQVIEEIKTYDGTSTIGGLMVDPSGNYWYTETDIAYNVPCYLYRYNKTTKINERVQLLNIPHTGNITAGTVGAVDITTDGTNVYISCYAMGTVNGVANVNQYKIIRCTLANLISSLGGTFDTRGANSTTIYTGNGGTDSPHLNIIGLCYDTDDNRLVIMNAFTDTIHILNSPSTISSPTATSEFYKLPIEATEFPSKNGRGIAYKNQQYYIACYSNNVESPNKIFVIDKKLSYGSSTPSNRKTYISHIYQTPSHMTNLLANNNYTTVMLDFDGNDLVVMQNTTSSTPAIHGQRIYKMKTLEDSSVMQVQFFLNKNDGMLLLSNNISHTTPIAERYFEPTKFKDIRDCPDKNYMCVSYNDEGFSILHLDEFLNDYSSSGMPRYDVRKIRSQHYKRGENNLIHNVGCYIVYICIEKDMIFAIKIASGGTGVYMIDLVSGKNYELTTSNWTNSGKYYNGTLSERNDAKGYAGTYNSGLDIGSVVAHQPYFISARTFTKDDDTDYNFEYPKTYFLVGLSNSGGINNPYVVEVDWNEKERIPIRSISFGTPTNPYVGLIASSGYIFLSDLASGVLYMSEVPVWNTSLAHNISITTLTSALGTSVTEISPNSRCWKLPSGQWRHQILISGYSSTTSLYKKLMIYDVEKATINHIWLLSALTVNHGFSWSDLNDNENEIIATYRINSNAISTLRIFKRTYSSDKTVSIATNKPANYSTKIENLDYNHLTSPIFLRSYGATCYITRPAVNKKNNMYVFGSGGALGKGVQGIVKDLCNNGYYYSKEKILEFNPTKLYFDYEISEGE